MKPHLLKLLHYNVWANEKIASYIISAGEERAITEQKSSFSNIRKTLFHIFHAEDIWLHRARGITTKNLSSLNFDGTAAEGCVKLVSISNAWAAFLAGMDEALLNIPVSYINMKGEHCSNTPHEIVSHLVNHGTYHRGQLITLLRATGFEGVGSTDLINYYRETAI